ncbi:hypothetical protein MRB53_013874 [Persea americana]|uniref:Uncharacterized protein n=1 Tax=Persea americana TaxID=3435 RepID=A0ACC2K9G0_PERAE|nr:hypothetical protein MRB53_013874 [Persea americana]
MPPLRCPLLHAAWQVGPAVHCLCIAKHNQDDCCTAGTAASKLLGTVVCWPMRPVHCSAQCQPAGALLSVAGGFQLWDPL